MLRDTKAELLHLGLSKAGHPKHPLYIAYTQQPQIWDGAVTSEIARVSGPKHTAR